MCSGRERDRQQRQGAGGGVAWVVRVSGKGSGLGVKFGSVWVGEEREWLGLVGLNS